jgi:hypothetical protein
VNLRIALFSFLGLFVWLLLGACASDRLEGIGPIDALPPPVRADYEVFAQRCSKCHSLARPLSSGIEDDSYWRMYVTRMRRQPGSGISIEDTVKILRFLSYYSRELKAKRESDAAAPSSPSPPSSFSPPSSEPLGEAGAP